MKTFILKDLLLVPLSLVLLICLLPTLEINQSLVYISLLVLKWSYIISIYLSKLNDKVSKVRVLKISDSLDTNLDILLNDSIIVKLGNEKKN